MKRSESPWLCASLLLVAVLALGGCKRGPAGAPSTQAASSSQTEPSMQTEPSATGSSTDPKTPVSLRVATLDGGTFDLADHRGRWVLVNFWATWCSPCLKEMPELSALDAMREHIRVVGLAQEDISESDMRDFLKRRPVVYPVAIIGLETPLPGFEGVTGLPMTFLVAPDGTLAKRYAGVLTAQKVEADIAALGGPAPGA
ncbi:MAG: TlpA disulfide reductase family protein [Pseudoxanthomonas suwonensis]|nr:TlpA disulfide reductase family protein [Pseudoxanthomonas suwonensis]